MPVPVVAIEISAPAPVAPSRVQALLAACNHAASGAACQESDASVGAAAPAAVAIVAWQNDEVARLEIGVRHEGATRWSTRRIVFRAEDEPAERWRTVGFVIGTIVGQTSPEIDRKNVLPARRVAPDVPRTVEVPEAPPPEAPQTATRGWLEGTGVASPVSFSGPWLAGFAGRAALGARDWPVLGTASAAYAWQLVPLESIRSNWLSLSTGLVYPIAAMTDPIEVDLRLEAIIRQQHLVSALPDGSRDEGKRWLGGAQVGVDVFWPLTSHWGVCSAAEIFVLGGRTTINQFGKDVYDLGAFGVQLSLGSRVRW